jgi:hypothetical protein
MVSAPPIVPGHAAQELQPGDPLFGGLLGDGAVQRSGAGEERAVAAGGDLREGAAGEADDDALHAAVAHQQVGADADRGDRHAGIEGGEEGGQVVEVLGQEQHVSRAADAEPSVGGERGVGDQLAARGGEARAPSHAIAPARWGVPPCPALRMGQHAFELSGQRIRPLRDVPRPEQYHEVPRPRLLRNHGGQRRGAIEGERPPVAVALQALDQCVPAEALQRRLAAA